MTTSMTLTQDSLRSLFSLGGRTALITGSSRGIGRALALGFAAYGADVAVHCRSRFEQAQEVAETAASYGARSCALQADLADEEGPQILYEQTLERLGHIDILVLNASVQVRKAWSEITRDEFELQVTVNWRASLELIQFALPGMIERGWGRILTVGSVQQALPHPQMAVYAGTKAAQENMVRNLAKQVAEHGVTVNNLAPGVIDTERNEKYLSDTVYRQRVLESIPVDFVGVPGDCVGAALLLCSEAGRYITGVDLLVDGGMALP
jgi:NAD(P)-dependent dehydrogenase (short-subunit alcohol dehydrogenase family)